MFDFVTILFLNTGKHKGKPNAEIKKMLKFY